MAKVTPTSQGAQIDPEVLGRVGGHPVQAVARGKWQGDVREREHIERV